VRTNPSTKIPIKVFVSGMTMIVYCLGKYCRFNKPAIWLETCFYGSDVTLNKNSRVLNNFFSKSSILRWVVNNYVVSLIGGSKNAGVSGAAALVTLRQ
jgi:hypothetical protein